MYSSIVGNIVMAGWVLYMKVFYGIPKGWPFEPGGIRNVWDEIQWFIDNKMPLYSNFVALVALISIIILLVNKRWGHISNIIFGGALLLWGIFAIACTFYWSPWLNPIEYVVTMYDHTFLPLLYGIFLIIFFTRKSVRDYIKRSSPQKE